MRMRPEAEQKLRAGFQRRVDEQAERYAAQLARAGQVTARFGCGEVLGVYTAQAGGNPRPRTFVVGLLPLAAIPVLIAAAAAGVPAIGPLLVAFPFIAGAWIGVSFWRLREPKRQIWFYAFAGGFMLLDNPPPGAAPVRWSQVAEVREVWTDTYRPGDEDAATPTLTAWRLRSADGQVHEISRSFRNVQDPYREMGQLLRMLAPGTLGKTMPKFPAIDDIIGAYARRPDHPGWP
jgi:hypothetical protein